MTVGIVDTTVLIHLYRNDPRALMWADALTQRFALTSMTWFEFMVGVGSKVAQTRCQTIVHQFDLLTLSHADQEWAMQQFQRYRFSHGIGVNDCLIAAVAHRLQVPLYTHNLKHLQVLLGNTFAQKPY